MFFKYFFDFIDLQKDSLSYHIFIVRITIERMINLRFNSSMKLCLLLPIC